MIGKFFILLVVVVVVTLCCQRRDTERERETLCFYINKAFSLSKLSRENKEGSAQPSSSFDLYAMMIMHDEMMMCEEILRCCFCFFEEDEKKKREAFLDGDFSATFRGDFSRKRVRVDEDISLYYSIPCRETRSHHATITMSSFGRRAKEAFSIPITTFPESLHPLLKEIDGPDGMEA